MSWSKLPLALLISASLHVCLLVVTFAPGDARALAGPMANEYPPDPWNGDTFDVEVLEAADLDKEAQASEPAGPSVPALLGPSPSPDPVVAASPPTRAPPRQKERFLAPPARRVESALPARTSEPAAPSPGVEFALPAKAAHPLPLSSSAPVPAASAVSLGTAGSAAPVAVAQSRFGAAGSAGAMRPLGRAFTRALPAAALGKDGWLDLPPGRAAEVLVTLTVDDSGSLLAPDFGDAQPTGPLAALVRRAQLLLQRGRFSIGDEVGAGSQTFALSVESSDERPTGDPFAEDSHIMRRGFEPPTADQPGRAYFAFACGRYVQVHVAIVR